MAVLAARAYGLDIIDGVYNNFSDEEGLTKECDQGRDMGFDGKTLIHPAQLAVTNEVFAPSSEDIALADLKIEMLFPADEATRRVLVEMFGGGDQADGQASA